MVGAFEVTMASGRGVGELTLGSLSIPRSKEWRETHDPRKSQLYENKEDGEFW